MHSVECESGVLEEPCGNHTNANDRGAEACYQTFPVQISPGEASPSQASADELQTRFGPLPLDPDRRRNG